MLLLEQVENLKAQKTTIDNISNNNNIENENKNLIIKLLLLEEENEKLKIDNIKFIKKYKLDKNVDNNAVNVISQNPNNINDGIYNNITTTMKRIAKSSDGFYYIDQCKYKNCFGSRQDVWNGDAYKTTGELTKSDLMINKNGKIISKTKFVQEKTFNRLEHVNIAKKKIIENPTF